MKFDELVNISENKINGLCCSCGICSGICPKNAITFQNINGMYLPNVNDELCIKCGLCVKNCPGLCQDYSNKNNELQEPLEAAKGNAIFCMNAWSNDKTIRKISASGGIITTLIKSLLEKNIYDVAFCVDKYNYNSQLSTEIFDKNTFWAQNKNEWVTPKSRYLPVSHEKAIRYILNNRDKKVIMTAVPCAIEGIVNVIRNMQLNKDNYLLLGLFCEKQFQYNINYYFNNIVKKRINKIHFKNKESGGWPGNIKIFYSNNEYEYIDKNYRTRIKGYFQPERCLYCIDKLATKADISLGDNYTGINESKEGSNSLIIRTQNGLKAWNYCHNNIESHNIQIDQIFDAEALNERIVNCTFVSYKNNSLIKEGLFPASINKGIIIENKQNEQNYKKQLNKLKIGENYKNNPKILEYEIRKEFIIYKIKILIYIIKNKLSKLRKIIKNGK